jgi:phospholipase C
MTGKAPRRSRLHCAVAGSMVVYLLGGQPASAATEATKTATPIEHLIVIIGDGRSFDHLFATYAPKKGQTIENLLSKGIVEANGAPGANFAKAGQFQASDKTTYMISPGGKAVYATLPPPGTGMAPKAASDTAGPPYKTLATAEKNDKDLSGSDDKLLLTGATGLAPQSVDTRIANASKLKNGPYQLTPGQPYDSYAGSPAHRFYQMWQELDCSAKAASAANPSGCLADLFPWVEVTIGNGTSGALPPMTSGKNGTPLPYNSKEGAAALGFYNMQKGDAPYFKALADSYTISDNYHQSVMGGRGANAIAMATGDAIFYSDNTGEPDTPAFSLIDDPDTYPKENNYYLNDGYGSSLTREGGAYTACSDTTQQGVAAITRYLSALKLKTNCLPNRYYLLNDEAPAYVRNGSIDSGAFSATPSTLATIGDRLTAAKVSWSYFGEGWDSYKAGATLAASHYCAICNPFQYMKSIMTSPAGRAHLEDMPEFYSTLTKGTLPAVSFVRPGALNDGAPATSKNDLFESFTKKVVAALQANKTLWASTAVLIVYQDGGGYYDSGYVQPLDFFGDGMRVPMFAVSPFSKGGHVVHDYYDHASILKFIEKNWGLTPLSSRSRDNLPNPVTKLGAPYIPTNRPAVGDLTGLFVFPAK